MKPMIFPSLIDPQRRPRFQPSWLRETDSDSESGSVNPPHGAWRRGIRVGSAKDGKVAFFIPDPSSVGETFQMVDGKPVMKKADGSPGATGTLAAEGVTVDAAGNIYGAEVGPKAVKKYVKK